VGQVAVQLLLFFLVDDIEAWAVQEAAFAATTGAGSECSLRHKGGARGTAVGAAGGVRYGLEKAIVARVSAGSGRSGAQGQEASAQ